MQGTIKKNSQGLWVADVTIQGVRKTKSTKLKKDAIEARKQLLDELLGKEAKPLRQGHITLKEAMRLTIDKHSKNMSSEKAQAGGMRKIVAYYERKKRGFLLKDVNAMNWDEFRKYCLSEAEEPSTINKKQSYLCNMFNVAVTYGRLDSKPALPRRYPTGSKNKKRVISPEEQNKFKECFVIRGHTELADMFDFCIETCARWGEVERIKRKDVNLKNRTITFWKTKNGDPRTIPLTSRAYEIILEYLPKTDHRRAFNVPYSTARDQIDIAKAEMGLSHDKKLSWHCTRHTCATKLGSSGKINAFQLMKYGGWKSQAAVACYMHLDTTALEVCREILEE
tara:strand:- start:2792 stop:3805 length:1014 start_codon:yes stop_codon:yes gene_type:complete